jgi:lysozyme family protein
MKQNFNDCLNRLLKDEGGYGNDPQDPGGPTNFGITLTDYRKYIKSTGNATDVKNMTRDQASVIYKERYWNVLGCDNLPSGVDYTCFDYGVNSGVGRPQKALQRFKALTGTKLINAINDERMSFLQALSTYPRFGKGWSARVARVRAHSIELATNKNSSAGPAVAAGVAAGGGVASHYWQSHEYLILGGAVVVALIAAYFIHNLINQGKQ